MNDVVLASPDMERALIGALLVDGTRMAEVIQGVEASDFTIAQCRDIYAAMETLFVYNRQIDTYTVSQQLAKSDKAIALPDLLVYASQTVDAANLTEYASEVHALAVRRRYAEAGARISALVSRHHDIDQLASEAIAILVRIGSQEQRRSGLVQVAQSAEAHQRARMEALRSQKPSDMLTSFSPQFNAIAQGYERGRVYTFSGRPGIGKSSWLMTEFVHQASLGKKVVFFQLEMMQSEMIDTFAAIRSGIPYSSIKTSRFETPDQYALYRSVMGDIVRWQNAYIDCTPAITPSYVLQKCLTLRHQLGGLDGVFIDYIGLMNSDDRKELNRDRIAAITRVIKSHAKTLDAPIIQAAQLSRAVEMRGVVRPQLSDLAESGTIEQDSDAVFAFWRSDKHVLSNGKPDEILTQVACLKLRYERAADFAIIFAGSIRGFLPTILDEDQVDMSAW